MLLTKSRWYNSERFYIQSRMQINRYMYKVGLYLILLVSSQISIAQNVGINETGSDPDNSAILDINSQTKGLLIPRLTRTQRMGILAPANGLLIYQTNDTIGFWYYDQSSWKPVFQQLTAGVGLNGGTVKAFGTIDLKPTTVQTGTYGYPDSIPQFTVNQFGQLVFARNLPFAEKDAVVGNELTDTSDALGMLTRKGLGTMASPFTVGVNPGNNVRDIWIWDGKKWGFMSLPFEIDSIIGNELSDTVQSLGLLFKQGSGTSSDPYKIGVTPGLNPGDVWMWDGNKWISGNIIFPKEQDSVIGNEVADSLNSYGILTRFGAGTNADPYKLGINAGKNAGDVWMWDGTTWKSSKFIIPDERDSVIGNEVADTINSRGIINLFGTGTAVDPLKIGVKSGNNVGEVWMWDGAKWAPSTIIHPTITFPLEKDSIIGNEIADTVNSFGILRKFGAGTAVNPYKIGITPGNSTGQSWMWNGSKWTLTTIIHPKEKDSVIGNELADTLNARGVLTRSGAGTSGNPFTVGVTVGSAIGDVWMWSGTKWTPTQITHPAEQDSIIGNEVTDTTNARGILNKSGTGTTVSPFKLSINPGSTVNDVWSWNGSKWVPKQLPVEVDGIVGNEVSDTIANGFLNLTGAGTAASPRKIGLKPGNTVGDVMMWNGTEWSTGYLPRNTLDKAYDEGGSGVGRKIVADAGAVEVNGTDGFTVSGTYAAGVAPGSPGAGVRMTFNPRTSSLRAGRVTGTQWDGINTGNYSFAGGYNTLAKGINSFAFGSFASAKDDHAIALGDSTMANNRYSIAIGDHSRADGVNAISIGENTWAYGQNSIVIGRNSYAQQAFTGIFGEESYNNGRYAYVFGYKDTAIGDYSTAIGYKAYAEGLSSVAIGTSVRANNPYSTAIGNNAYAIADRSFALGSYVSTNFKNGSFILGDNSTTTVTNSNTLNEMTTRFAGGYRIFSNAGLSLGVYMAGGTSGWNNYSDREMKDNFEKLDGEEILKSIDRIEISKWTYKEGNPDVKYIGPMAQDFHREFKLNGNDSLGINSISIDGVNMAAIQALIRRTENVKTMEQKLTQYEIQLIQQQEEIERLKLAVDKLLQLNNSDND